ncbi:aminotransferase-like domain-containing protein [Desulfocicer niacini]
MNYSKLFSEIALRTKPSVIRSIMSRIQPDTISFAAGQPAHVIFPKERIRETMLSFLDRHGAEPLQYSSTIGYRPLRKWIAESTKHASVENVLIISGAQQAIDFMARVFINKGDKVAVAAPTYTAAISSFEAYGAELIEIKCDNDGMIPQSMEEAFQKKPKFVYCIPNFMNPTGVDMTIQRRQIMVELARQYDIHILEDDPYGKLRFEGSDQPTLLDLAPERVVYTGTFSKVFAPGFRVGWLIAPSEIREKMTFIKAADDLQVSTFTQMLIYDALKDSFYDGQIKRVRKYYMDQRNLMISAMKHYLPDWVTYQVPQGGFFVWCSLPAKINTVKMLDMAFQSKVAYIPGQPFYSHGEGKNCLRLSFSLPSKEEINLGMSRLAKVLTTSLN